MEFRYREADFASYPKGLIYGLDILDNWLYDDEHPFVQVELNPVFARLKEQKGNRFWENLIAKISSEQSAWFCADLETVQRTGGTESAKLWRINWQTILTVFQKKKNRHWQIRRRALETYQELPEDPEAAKCIPMLKREDISTKVAPFSNTELKVGDRLFLYHEVPTNGIGYLDVMFDLKDLDESMVPYLGLLKSVLGFVDTEHYSYSELSNEINTETGGIACGVEVFEQADSTDAYKAFFGIRGKVMYPEN